MSQEKCPDGKHVPEIIRTIKKWKEGVTCGGCLKGDTVIFQCAVCGYRWSEERTFRDYYSYRRGEWSWIRI